MPPCEVAGAIQEEGAGDVIDDAAAIPVPTADDGVGLLAGGFFTGELDGWHSAGACRGSTTGSQREEGSGNESEQKGFHELRLVVDPGCERHSCTARNLASAWSGCQNRRGAKIAGLEVMGVRAFGLRGGLVAIRGRNRGFGVVRGGV